MAKTIFVAYPTSKLRIDIAAATPRKATHNTNDRILTTAQTPK